MLPTVCHLVEARSDQASETVTRLTQKAGLGQVTHHVISVPVGALRATAIDADIIVSHLPIKWRRFPYLVALRAANSNRTIIHIQGNNRRNPKGQGRVNRSHTAALHNCVYALFDRVERPHT